MKKRSYLRYVLFLSVCCAVLTCVSITVHAKTRKTYESMEAKVTVSSFTKVRLSWPKKKNITKVIIYGGLTDRNGNIRTGKKVKTLQGNRTSATLKVKKKKNYGWRIEAQGKVSKGKQTIWTSEVYAHTDVAAAWFDDYQYFEGKVSPKDISLRFYINDGIRPDGAQIRRKPVSGGRYETIKTFKKSRESYSFTDKAVETGKGYLYQVRAWKKIGGRKVYGPADQVEMYAVNQTAALNVNRVSAENPEEDVIRVDSDAGNGEISVSAEDMAAMQWVDTEGLKRYSLTGISENGTSWTMPEKDGGEIVMKPGESKYLRFEITQISEEDAEEAEEDWDYGAGPGQCCVPASYHGQGCTFLVLDVPGETGYTMQDSESIH